MADNKRYYWLKLKRDFFKRHDVRIIEEMPNGKDYILFYLKLLLESIDHEGELRFSDTIPYNENMLAVITNTNIDVVRSAMRVFIELKMIEMFDDQTIYMVETQRLIGSESASAERVRNCRRNQQLLQCNTDVTKCNTEIDKDKELKKDQDIVDVSQKRKRFAPPTLEEVKAYCKERGDKVDPQRFYDYFTASNWHDSEGKKVISWKQKVITWERFGSKPDNANKSDSGSFDTDDFFEAAIARSGNKEVG